MDNSNVLVRGNREMNEGKPPPRVCPRCNSDNTKFYYYNNYSVSQPRYICKNCRRYWTHGGALRNIPIGGSGRKTKRTRIDQPSISQVVSVEIQQINHHLPFLHVQETNEFLGYFGGSSSSSSVAIGNHFGSLHQFHGDMVLPVRSIPPMDPLDLSEGSVHQGYYDVGSSDLVANPLINQSIGEHVNNYNSYRVNQEDPNKLNQSFNNTMNMNYNASTSGSRGYPGTDHMIENNNNKVRNKGVLKSSYHVEKHGP